MKQPFLKIKIKALAAESRIIREAEQTCRQHMNNCRNWIDGGENRRTGVYHRRPGEMKEGLLEYWKEHHKELMDLKTHRKGMDGSGGIRHEARHSSLAYAFLREKPYRAIEEKVHQGNEPDMEAIHRIVERFGGKRNPGEVEAWLEAA